MGFYPSGNRIYRMWGENILSMEDLWENYRSKWGDFPVPQASRAPWSVAAPVVLPDGEGGRQDEVQVGSTVVNRVGDTVDGRNPAPLNRLFIPLFIGFLPSQVVQDFATIHCRIPFFKKSARWKSSQGWFPSGFRNHFWFPSCFWSGIHHVFDLLNFASHKRNEPEDMGLTPHMFFFPREMPRIR